MYKVSIYNDGDETIIHSPFVNDLKIADGKVKTEINKIEFFNFTFYMNSPAYGQVHPLTTLVKVLDIKRNEYVFEGRILAPSDDMGTDGLHSTSFDCEGELAYLHDSQQRHLEFRGTPTELMSEILNYHNTQVEDYKHFEVGNIEVTNSTNNLYIYLSAEEDSFESMESKLIDSLGGELRIRKENGIRYLDLLENIGEDKETEIRIAKNLKSMSRDVDPTEIITRLTPLGTRIESTDEKATDASQARLTIESVNNGLSYLDDDNLIALFGVQGGSKTWDDVTDVNNLLTKGQGFFANQKTARTQYQISAADLSIIGLAIDQFSVGNTHPVYNPIMGVDERLRVIGKTIDINAPESDSLTIGDKFKTLNEYQSDLNKSARQLVELESTVGKQSQTINNIKFELNEVDSAVQQVQLTLSESDLPALEQAVEDLNTAINNLDDAVNDIPVYDPATTTTDGLMASTDKVKLDGLANYDPATELNDGLMSNEDKAKLNLITILNNTNIDDLKAKLDLITVIDPVDLNNIVSRLETLENA